MRNKKLNDLKILVLMTTFNDNKGQLKKSIKSILNQTYTNFDFLIINDGSSNREEIISLVNRFGDNRIILNHNDENIGLANSLNKGLREFQNSYNYIVRMDADDISSKYRLEFLFNHMEINPKIDICSSYGFMFGQIFRPIVYFTNNEEIRIDLLFRSPILHAGCIIRTESIINHKIKYNNVTAEDYDLWFRLSKKEDINFSNIPKFIYYYRIKVPANLNKIKSQNRVMNEIYKHYLPDISESNRLNFIKILSKGYSTSKELHLLFEVFEKIKDKFMNLGFNETNVNRTLQTRIIINLVKSNILNSPEDLRKQKILLNEFQINSQYEGSRMHKIFLGIFYSASYTLNLLLNLIRS
jgi:glycosyltransferase involved in cell wall biosynthesis